MSAHEPMEYGKTYDAYWQRSDRVGERSGDLNKVAEWLMATCGIGMTLDVGSGEGFLVGELLRKGIDAYGLDVSEVVVARSNEKWPGRFQKGSVLSLPYEDETFQTVVSTDCMEHLAPVDVLTALREMYRVSSRFVFLQLATTQDRDKHWHLTVEGRAWWESRCFEVGFRKHPSYYRVNSYESLNKDDWQIFVLLEKLPSAAVKRYPISALDEHRLLHMDMLRETGRRGDAHCIRYYMAAQYIRPGDTVLDVACGLGYGSHILFQNSLAKSVLGVDNSDRGIEYAEVNYGLEDAVQFRVGDAQDLSFLPDNSVDFITGFETIEHVPDPKKYLGELQRVLRPSGRLMICAPNDWTDETGKDPNPHHLHVYTWKRLIEECRDLFLLEKGFSQVAGGAMKHTHSPRKWAEVSLHTIPDSESEWAVLLCMNDPLGGKVIPYQETVWKIPESSDFHVAAFARDYDNPWLVKGMVAIGMRNQSTDNLQSIQKRVLEVSDPQSVDYGAALCGLVYSVLAESHITETEYGSLLKRIKAYATILTPAPHQLRWQVSLLFAGAELARKRGDFKDAVALYAACAEKDVMPYSPVLGNKTLDALYWLAVMAVGQQDHAAARVHLIKCIEEAKRLTAGSWANICGDTAYPIPFGLAELAQLMDKASRAAYMLASLGTAEKRPGVIAGEAKGYYERVLFWKDNDVHMLRKRVQDLASEVAQWQMQIATMAEALSERTRQLAQSNAATERLHHQYSEVLHSKSWKLTKPLRALARLLSYRSFMSIDRSIVLSRAKSIAHTLSVPRWVKTRLRSFLWASENPQFRDDEKLLSGRPMRPECCALTPGQVSVILPVYNQASMLEESIESVLRQTYEHLELIVLNDGSSDNVERVLEKYVGHPKVRIYSQVNQKLPRALSNAFELAHGEYWTWTSADNLMEPQQLDSLVSRLRKEPMLGMVYADYYAIDDRGQLLRDPLWRRHNRPDPRSGEIRLPRTTHLLNREQDNFIGPCFLYRGWIGRILGEYDSLQGVEDYDYWMRMNSLFSIKHLGTNELLYRYRVHDNTLNARALEEKIGEKVQKLMRYEKKRADFYRKPLEFCADPVSSEWLEEAGVPRSQIRPIVSLSSRTSDQPRVLVCSAAALNKFHEPFYEYASIPVVIFFNEPKPMPYDLAPFLRRSGVLAAVRDQRTASRVRIVQPIPVVDADAKEISKAITAFALNLIFYTSTRGTTNLVRSSPHPFSYKPSSRNVLLQVDNFVQGGMENVIMDLAYTLAKEGIDSRILVLGKAGEAMVKARDRGLTVDVCDGRLDQREYKNYLMSHNVMLINSHYSVFGSEAAREIEIPLVQTIHNSYVWMDGDMVNRYRASDKHTTKYVCVSLTAAKYSDAILGLDATKMVVIPNGIDTSVFSCFDPRRERERLRRRWGFGENDSIFLNVASIHATKAQLPLVRAFAMHVEKHSRSRLVLLGSVMDEAYNQQIKEFVKRSGLEKQVIFAGYDKEVAPYYYAADIFVLPSFWEGWSLSFGEALYTGMPIVATDVGAAREFSHLSNVLLIEPPFGDITNLNYLNLEKYVQGENEEFDARLAQVMSDSLKHQRISPSIELRNQLDRSHAYQSYLSLVKTI